MTQRNTGTWENEGQRLSTAGHGGQPAAWLGHSGQRETRGCGCWVGRSSGGVVTGDSTRWVARAGLLLT